MKILKRLTLPALLTLLIFPLFVANAQAAPAEFGREFGLFVHQKNQAEPVPLAKGEQVMASYFAGNFLKVSAAENGQREMSQRQFLLEFEKLRMEQEGLETKLSDTLLYPITWLKARRYNWLPDTRLTYKTMQEFLYRYSVSEKFGGIPYFDGLVLDEEDINVNNFNSISEVRAINEDFSRRMAEIRKLERPTKRQKELLQGLVSYAEKYSELELELRELYHPLNRIANLPEDIQQKIKDYDLNEILEQVSYNYSHNNANRIHNLVTGAEQMSGKVYLPDEVINFEEELGKNGWYQYKYGWVIFGGVDTWQFGGGLCGSATMTFTPSWRAGLEVIRRYPHSVYYTSLYPEESLGLDATIYRGHKNLIMKNTTGSPVLYYLENDAEKKEVTMYVIGNSPYKNIAIEGPIKDSWNSYKWIRRMEGFDGKVVEDELVTKYGLVY